LDQHLEINSMTNRTQFTLVPREPESADYIEQLRARWSEDTDLAKQLQEVLSGKAPIPADWPTVIVIYREKELRLADLRGLSLHQTTIRAVDLSYCSLDFSDFKGSFFDGTHLQFSSAKHSRFDSCYWHNVQAAPFYAVHTSFRKAEIESSFLMHSDLREADFSGAQITNTRLTASDLTGARLSESSWSNNDLVDATMPEEIDHIFPNSSATPNLVSSRSTSRGPSLTVMVVDDSSTVRTTLKHYLTNKGYHVLLATNGAMAVEVLNHESPDLLLIDIHMPKVDGYDLAKHVRRAAVTRDLPIIMMTGQSSDAARRSAMAAGANLYVSKPLEMDDIDRRIRQLLDQHISHA
jgi:CheY-like chemotaxis protein